MINSRVMNRIVDDCPNVIDSLSELLLYNEFILELSGDDNAGQHLQFVNRLKSGNLNVNEIAFIQSGAFMVSYGSRVAINENEIKSYELYVMKEAIDKDKL